MMDVETAGPAARPVSPRGGDGDSRPRLRLLHVAETYPPEYGGGAAIYVRDVCRGLAERGHAVTVVCTTASDQREPYSWTTEQDGAVRVVRVNLPYFKTVDPEGWQLGMRRWREHEARVAEVITAIHQGCRPDLVHYSAARPFGEECLFTLARLGAPVVGFLHEAWLLCGRLMLLRSPTRTPCPGPSPVRCLECMYSHYDGSHLRAAVKMPWRVAKLRSYIAYRMRRRAQARKLLSGALAYSRFMAEVHAPHVPGLIEYVPLGVNVPAPVVPVRRPRTPVRFGFFAGFQGNKGIEDVLGAARELREDGADFELHVWGPGADPAERAGSEEYGDWVRFHGLYDSQAWPEAYAQVDVAIMATTVLEPLGRIVLEAATCGAPTIAPRIGGIPEMIRDGVDGLLYEFRNRAALRECMRQVIDRPELLDRLIENVRQPRTTPSMIPAVEDFYSRILSLANR